MATARKILERAFSMMGVRAAETPLEASEVNDGLDVLNDLLALWDSTGVIKGVAPVADVDDVVIAPRQALPALKANVALQLAGEYGVQVTQSLAHAATDSLAQLVTSTIQLDTVDLPGTLPRGSGNRRDCEDYLGQDFFPGGKKSNF